jgi:hypothetical protein
MATLHDHFFVCVDATGEIKKQPGNVRPVISYYTDRAAQVNKGAVSLQAFIRSRMELVALGHEEKELNKLRRYTYGGKELRAANGELR